MQKIILLELNEINFNFIKRYNEKGFLPHFKKLFENNGFSETTSEKEYRNLEPWIQWVTAHTGLDYDEHGVFRLGDIVNHSYEQIWERLERKKKIKVGAISPFNAKNKLEKAAFFIPDPWTSTHVTGTRLDKLLSNAISQAVNNNAEGKITLKSKLALIIGLLLYANIRNYSKYISLILNAHKKPWYKAIFLDLFLADVFLNKWVEHKPAFSSLFLNAGAHIQHHYMFSSKVYDGKMKNPHWYINQDEDPLLEVFQIYDEIIGQILKKAPDLHLLIATALTQEPYQTEKYYYRLKDHKAFLSKIAVPYLDVEPRMSRDFLIHCAHGEEAKKAEEKLLSFKSFDGLNMFSVDNRGNTLFVMLEYPKEINKKFQIIYGNKTYHNFYRDVAFVAIKNGGHRGNGFFLDNNSCPDNIPSTFELKKLPSLIEGFFK